jgi:2-dehydro-3-deoxyphosphogluconate aldolase/(4S)-4-hydroxy-2-oxoglutarate aldolase
MDVHRFQKLPLLGIVRGVAPEAIEGLIEAVIEAGLESLEITLNTPDAYRSLRLADRAARGRLMLGAGTVLSVEQLDRALDAGATFAVSPVLIDEVVAECTRRSVPVFPGAFTPTEIYRAACAGATMVKVFPAKFFGPGYFEEIRGPFEDIALLACGGVNEHNVASFFASGAAAVAFGGSVFRRDWLAARDFDSISTSVRQIVDATRAATFVSGRTSG